MKKIISILLLSGTLLSCSNDFLNTSPESTINDAQLATSPAGLQGLVDGIYTNLRTYGNAIGGNHEDYGHKSVLSALDLMSNDEFMSKSSWYSNFYNYNGRIQTSSRTTLIWNTYYPQIKVANTVINSLPDSQINNSNKSIAGQALALRALSYFMLARVFGPTYIGHTNDLCVPLYTEVSFEGKARSTVSEVYVQIVNDLTKSIGLLEGYNRPNKEKIDLSVAKGILAQVYLEMGNYPLAAQLAHSARTGYAQETEAQWLSGFYDLPNTSDAMWGSVITADNTSFVASFFSHWDNTNASGYAGGLGVYKGIDKRLYESIPNTDYRKKAFVGTTANPKYPDLPSYANLKFIDPTITEGDYIYLRASEMYYIEAEALARSGNEAMARSVLFDITSLRDSAYVLSTNTGASLINEILTQKRIEMWGEGCAWFDMKRLSIGLDRTYAGSNHPAFGKLKIDANTSKFIFQIPQAEINANPLIVQNPN